MSMVETNASPNEPAGNSKKASSNESSDSLKYDAFISYSRRDKAFADTLQKALGKYTPPKMMGIPSRRLRIFRDTEDLTGADYYQSIDQNLKSSAKLILICSPASAKSQYVNDEVKRFATYRTPADIIPVIIAGTPNNEVKPGSEDQAAFPPALCDALALPLAVSYQGFDQGKRKLNKSPYDGAWYTILANLLDVDRTEVERRELRRRRRQLRIRVAVVSSILLVLAGISLIAYWQNQIAIKNKAEATTQAALAIAIKIAQGALLEKESRPDLAALLSVEAARQAEDIKLPDDPEIYNALLTASQSNPRLVTLLNHPGPVNSISFSLNGQVLASGCQDGMLRLWDIAKRQLIGNPLAGHTGRILSVTFSPNGKLLATGGEDGTVRLWDVAARRPFGAPIINHQEPVTRVTFRPDGNTLASASNNAIWFWDVQTRQAQPVSANGAQIRSVTDVAFLPRGEALAVLEADGIGLLDLKTLTFTEDGADTSLFEAAMTMFTTTRLAVSGDSETLAVAVGKRISFQGVSLQENEPPKFMEAAILSGNGQPTSDHKSFAHSQQVLGVTFSPSGKMIASSSKDSSITIWNVPSLGSNGDYERLKFNGHRGSILDVAFSPNERLVASAGEDGNVAIWDLESPVITSRILSAQGPAVFRSDGKLVAKVANGARWHLWDSNGQHTPDPLNGQGHPPDGHVPLQITSLNQQLLAQVKKGHRAEISSLAMSSDGKMLATGSLDKTVRLWDALNGQPIGNSLGGFAGAIQSLAFSPNGAILACGSGDSREEKDRDGSDTNIHAVYLWDLKKNSWIGEPISGYAGWAVQVSFSPDGKSLATWTDQKEDKVILIDLNAKSLIRALCRRANRDLSLSEWKEYIGVHGGDIPYRSTCQLPSGDGAP